MHTSIPDIGFKGLQITVCTC